MTSIAILGATGNLGRHVASQALARGWRISVAVRSAARLSPDVAAQAKVSIFDLATASEDELARFVRGHDALVCCAGLVTEGDKFVSLIGRVISAIESIDCADRPPSWFMAGAALLDLDENGRRGVDLPKVRDTYWPHRANFERLQASSLDWRLLCPGPMVEQAGLGAERLRICVDKLAAPLAPVARMLPGPMVLPMFAMKIPEMIIPYADAAAVMLNNIGPASVMSRKRVSLALPAGMKGKKAEWTAKP